MPKTDQVLQSIAHMTHEAREKSVKSAEWDRVDRSGFYDDACAWEKVAVSTLICFCETKMSTNFPLFMIYNFILKKLIFFMLIFVTDDR